MNLPASDGFNPLGNLSSARTMTARALLLLAGLSAPAFGQFRDWQAGDGDWSVAGNWSPNGVPLSTETARIGNLLAAVNDWCYLDQNDTVAGLQVTDGMMLDMDGFQLVVNGNTLISGENYVDPVIYPSRVRVTGGAAATEFQTVNLTLADEAWFEMENNGVARVLGELSSADGCAVYAGGTINFQLNGVRAFNNNGSISVNGSSLTLNQAGTALLDLDGSGGTGVVSLSVFAVRQLNINGTALTDAFSSDINMSAGATLNMALSSGWTADATSSINAFGGGDDYPQPIQIMGAPMTVGGELSVAGTTGHLRMMPEATIVSTADVSVGTTDLITFENDTVVEGGTFTVAQGGELRFEGDTRVEGGIFTTPSGLFSDGRVVFDGQTDWFGDSTFNGAVRHNGNGHVLGNSVVDAIEFDMDGGGGVSPATWDINASFVLNAERLDQQDGSNNSGRFDGVMNISGGFLAGFTFNIAPPGFYWAMNGTLNLTGDPVFFMTRIAGSRMSVTGDVNVMSGRVQIAADMTLNSSAQVSIPANAILRSNASSAILPATFVGTGVFQNGPDGEMGFSNNVDTDFVGLVNEGQLTISGQHTLATVDRFQQTAGGELRLTIGGYSPGVEHDLLVITNGTAQLDGVLAVTLPDLGGPQFYPQPGDEFVVITADDGIVGSFDFDPITILDDLTFNWDVVYNPFNVTLRLVSVVPVCPGDVNGDGLVNGADLSVLLAQFGQNVEQWSGADLNGDGWVNGADLSVLLANFGNNCIAT